MEPPDKSEKIVKIAAIAVIAVAATGAVVAACSGFGTSLGFWGFRTGFSILSWGGMLEAAALAGAIGVGIAAARKGLWRPLLLSAFAAVAAGAITGTLLSWKLKASSVPPIHDITTDINNPPGFVAILPLRSGAPNTAAYPGAETALLQRKAYPDVRTALVQLPADRAFAAAADAARALGWRIVADVPQEGRMEATDTTFWFGFTDDIVIRVTPAGADRSLVDIRSVSRIGRSDVGTNAARIRKFLARLQPRM